jgi:hypothetical protein
VGEATSIRELRHRVLSSLRMDQSTEKATTMTRKEIDEAYLAHYWVIHEHEREQVVDFAVQQVNAALEEAAYKICFDCNLGRHEPKRCKSTEGVEIRNLKIKD